MTRLAPIALLFALLAPAQARTLAGVELPDTVVVDGATLRLNGMGLRAATALRVKAYVGGLYLEQPSSDAATVIDSHQRKRVTMKFLRDIDRQRLTSGWAGDDFARALFTVWFGPEPGDENLKRGMLGQ